MGHKIFDDRDRVYVMIEGKEHEADIVGRSFPSAWFVLLDEKYSDAYPYRCVCVTNENVSSFYPERSPPDVIRRR